MWGSNGWKRGGRHILAQSQWHECATPGPPFLLRPLAWARPELGGSGGINIGFSGVSSLLPYRLQPTPTLSWAHCRLEILGLLSLQKNTSQFCFCCFLVYCFNLCFFLIRLHAQCGAQTQDPEIKSCTLYRLSQPSIP